MILMYNYRIMTTVDVNIYNIICVAAARCQISGAYGMIAVVMSQIIDVF